MTADTSHPVATGEPTWSIWVTTVATPGLREVFVLNPLREAARQLRGSQDRRPACSICQAPYDPQVDVCCALCGSTPAFTRALKQAAPEDVLTALACFTLYGSRPYLALEPIMPDPTVRVACLLHTVAHPALTELWQDILMPTMPAAPAATDTWPWPFPFPSREHTALTTLTPDRLLAVLRAEEGSALETFRRARWEEDGTVTIRCPRCGTRAWVYHRVRHDGTTRWKCKTRDQRVEESLRKARRTHIIRPRLAINGCGFAFYDTTGTIFSEDRHLVPMADILPLLFYGEAYLHVLSVTLTPKILHRLLTRLLSIPVSQQPLVARLRAHAQRWVVTKVLAATTPSTATDLDASAATVKGA